MTSEATTHRAVEKALDILLCFVPNNRELGTTEVSRLMGFNKSTASRLLHVLSKKGFLQQDLQTKKFQLGPSTMVLGSAIRQSLNTNLVQIAKSHMERLRDLIKESVILEVFSETNTVLAHLVNGPHRINVAGSIGDILHAHAAAGAKVIVAFSSSGIREKVVNGSLPALTQNTITNPATLQKQFEKIRNTGFSFDNEEHDLGINAMGAPIFDYTRTPVAALVVVGPNHRIRPEFDSFIARHLKKSATDISKRLFYNSDFPNGK